MGDSSSEDDGDVFASHEQIQETVRNVAKRQVKELIETLAVPTPPNPNSAQILALQQRQVRQHRAAAGLAALLVPGVRVRKLPNGGSVVRSGEDVAWNWGVLVEAGAVPPLVELLSSGVEQVCFAAAAALSMLSHHPEAQRQAADAGAVGALVRLLANDDEVMQLSSLSALRTLGIQRTQRQAIRQAGGIQQLVRLLDAANPVTQESACSLLWQLSSDRARGPENRHAMEAAGVVPRVLRLIASPDDEVRSAAALLIEMLGLDTKAELAAQYAAEKEAEMLLRADYQRLEVDAKIKEQRAAQEAWILEKERKRKAEAAQREAEKQEASRKLQEAAAERERQINEQKEQEYRAWLEKMQVKREEEEAAGTAARRMKAAGKSALMGVVLGNEAKKKAEAKALAAATHEETEEERAHRLEAERAGSRMEEWSMEACEQWVRDVVGLPE